MDAYLLAICAKRLRNRIDEQFSRTNTGPGEYARKKTQFQPSVFGNSSVERPNQNSVPVAVSRQRKGIEKQ